MCPSTVRHVADQQTASIRGGPGVASIDRHAGGSGEEDVASETFDLEGGGTARYRGLRLRARGAGDARKWGDAFLSGGETGVAVLAADMPGDKRKECSNLITEYITSRQNLRVKPSPTPLHTILFAHLLCIAYMTHGHCTGTRWTAACRESGC